MLTGAVVGRNAEHDEMEGSEPAADEQVNEVEEVLLRGIGQRNWGRDIGGFVSVDADADSDGCCCCCGCCGCCSEADESRCSSATPAS